MSVLKVELALEERPRAEYPLEAMLRFQKRQHLAKEICGIQPIEGLEIPVRLLFEQFAAFIVNVGCKRAIHALPRTFAIDDGCLRDASVKDAREVAGHDGFAI